MITAWTTHTAGLQCRRDQLSWQENVYERSPSSFSADHSSCFFRGAPTPLIAESAWLTRLYKKKRADSPSKVKARRSLGTLFETILGIEFPRSGNLALVRRFKGFPSFRLPCRSSPHTSASHSFGFNLFIFLEIYLDHSFLSL